MKYLLLIAMVLIPALANAQSLVNPVLVGPQINKNIVSGNGFQIISTGLSCSTAASVGANCVQGATWLVPFVDTNYQVWCSCNGAAQGAPYIGFESIVSTTVVNILVIADTAAVAQCSTIVCLGIHP